VTNRPAGQKEVCSWLHMMGGGRGEGSSGGIVKRPLRALEGRRKRCGGESRWEGQVNKISQWGGENSGNAR